MSSTNSTFTKIEADPIRIFGEGSNLSGWQLFVGFFVVAAYMVVGSEGLNFIEDFTQGTSYHLMIQRIYREIMMMGLSSFVWTIIVASETSIPLGLYTGLQYADYNAFVMSIYFCVQGIFIMVGSMNQAMAWERASKISSEELQIDMEQAEKGWKWKSAYLPFSVTRDQVEFRILQSIFSSAYHISTKHTELNFGLFLQMTHEANLLSIIDFSNAKWLLVIIITGIEAVKLTFYKTSCSTASCAAEEEIWLLTVCGAINMLFALLVSFWGRQSEIKLMRVSGVESVEDYPVYLMVEAKMNELLERNVVQSNCVKTAIAELMTEAESTKIEEKHKKARKRRETMASITGKMSGKNKNPTGGASSGGSFASGKSTGGNSGRIHPFAEESISAASSRADSMMMVQDPPSAASTARRHSSGGREMNYVVSASEMPSVKPGGEAKVSPEATGELDVGVSRLGSSNEEEGEEVPGNGVPTEEEKDEHDKTSRRGLVKRSSTVGDGFVVRVVSLKPPEDSDMSSDEEDEDHFDEEKELSKSQKKADDENEEDLEAGERDAPSSPSSPSNTAASARPSNSISAIAGDMFSAAAKTASYVVGGGGSKTNTGTGQKNGVDLDEGSVTDSKLRNSVLSMAGDAISAATKRAAGIVNRGGRRMSKPSNIPMLGNIGESKRGSILGRNRLNEQKKDFKKNVKSNFGLQNFTNVFVFGSPSIFFNCIDFVITCNSLYLAWWTTNFVIVAKRADSVELEALLASISLIPALLTFPIISYAIKSSTILKALSSLNLDVLAAVVEKTESSVTNLSDFRSKLLDGMQEGMDVELSPSEIKNTMMNIYDDFSEDQCSLVLNEFLMLLHDYHIHYTPQKCKAIFRSLDINMDGGISIEEFERFLFPEEASAKDKKNQAFFDTKNNKMVSALGKRHVAKRILKFLDPSTNEGVSVHRRLSK